ncbi:ATP-binding protein [Pseudomonas sp. OIL-1]|uniref:ATP-binding protein n=1 Tax=Pseudomonas sp. OIL-1 TaxID=2706126 RepID=UPI0013A7277D|nr:ATP-binding protein [Pseudomonas sp. OIL-1]QIB53280.1 SpoIIE family protein phosphatase [Pseudomonas sp. OIL-1]
MNLAGTLTEVIPVDDDSRIGQARRRAKQLAEQLGFDQTGAGRAALVATELATNIFKHAQSGELHCRVVPGRGGQGIELIAIDRGPGFDAHRCLRDGFSTGGTPGEGLGSISRQSQVLDIYADERGAVVLARLFPRDVTDLRLGVNQHAMRNEAACGDVWHLALRGGKLSALVIDGLGHGEEAEEAGRCGAEAFAQRPFEHPDALLTDMHRAMNGTRGGAAAIAQYDADSGTLQFSGIGNIGARLISAQGSRGMASHPGIVGVQYRKAHTFTYAEANAQLLVMYSDGLQSRWDLGDYPALGMQHPATVAAVLHRDFCRGRDDVTVMAIDLELLNG